MAEGGVIWKSGPFIGASLKEHLYKFPAHLLDVVCAEAHLVQLTECFSEWQAHLSTSLQLTAVEMDDIENNCPGMLPDNEWRCLERGNKRTKNKQLTGVCG